MFGRSANIVAINVLKANSSKKDMGPAQNIFLHELAIHLAHESSYTLDIVNRQVPVIKYAFPIML